MPAEPADDRRAAPGDSPSPADAVALALILLVSAWLRLASLSYSHFQGDEVKALYPPDASFPAFLLAQRKGPMQFLVTRLTHAVTGGFDEQLTRLPFALASLLAVLVLYRLLLNEFGRRPALLGAALLGSCGLLIAFGRIVQYQSLLVLFVLLTALHALAWLRAGRATALYLAAIAYGLALLTHYDALVFLPTLAVLAWLGRRHTAARATWLRAAAISGGLAALFYLPFVLQPEFRAVRLYLQARVVAGSGLRAFVAVPALLDLYLPPGWLLIAMPLLLIGLTHVLFWRRSAAGVVVAVWFASTFAFYMLLGGDPRSHVYACFPPAVMLIALGLGALLAAVRHPALAAALLTGVWLLLAGGAFAAHAMLVDHRIEYPWQPKRLLGYPLPDLTAREMEGVFGFPYRRGLDQVGALFASGALRGTYASNEREAVTDYYFHAQRAAAPDYYVYVHRPLSLVRALPAEVAAGYPRVRTIALGGATTIEIYAAPTPAP